MVYRTTERSAQRKAAIRTQILRSAGKLFAARGYEATTMQEIVAQAKTSIGNLYFNFENKEALLGALLESAFVDMFDAAERRAEKIADGPEKIGTIVALNATGVLTARSRMLAILTAGSRSAVVQRVGDIAVARWVRILQGAFPTRSADELALVAAAIWGANRSIVERTALGALATDTKATVTFMVRWTLRALETEPARIDRIVGTAWRLAVRHARELEGRPW